MTQWWKENFNWIKWLAGILFWVASILLTNYVSFRETKSEIKLVDEKFNMVIKALDNFDHRFTTIEEYILYKEKK